MLTIEIVSLCIYIWYGMVWYIWNIYFIYLTKRTRTRARRIHKPDVYLKDCGVRQMKSGE